MDLLGIRRRRRRRIRCIYYAPEFQPWVRAEGLGCWTWSRRHTRIKCSGRQPDAQIVPKYSHYGESVHTLEARAKDPHMDAERTGGKDRGQEGMREGNGQKKSQRKRNDPVLQTLLQMCPWKDQTSDPQNQGKRWENMFTTRATARNNPGRRVNHWKTSSPIRRDSVGSWVAYRRASMQVSARQESKIRKSA